MTPELVIEVSLAAVVAALIQCVSHWFPWRGALQRELPRIPAYILGMLGILLPVSVLYWHWDVNAVGLPQHAYLVGLWVCVVASGLAVLIVYWIDWLVDVLARLRESNEREDAAMSVLRERDAQG
jgi:uncharacterized membrane protein